jgi:pimeloyl-ACP methyl ester carboxylesterase
MLASHPGGTVDLEILEAHPGGGARAGPPFLFVHGAWHAAWCWADHVLPFVAARGHDAFAVSLRGHGGSPCPRGLRRTTLRDYVDDVAAAVRSVGAPPVVVGHSIGGLIVQRYLTGGGSAVAGVLLASAPPSGTLGATLRMARRDPLAHLHMNLTWSLWPAVSTPARAKTWLLPDSFGDAESRAVHARLQDDSFLAAMAMFFAPRVDPARVRVPMLVMGAGEDRIISVAEVRATARAYGVQAEIVPDAAHDLMLDPAWERVALRLVEWAGALGGAAADATATAGGAEPAAPSYRNP